ncbi:MAG: metallophosphoesterase family protein [Planctomycetes bacterium]|nr:metallophosphoesterase family protein [Planctomycetota bacterium]
MRIGILGDIHSNVEALRAVVDALRHDDADIFVQVGDIVGYGPDPSPCVDIVRDLGCITCMGNHDAAVLGLLDLSYFNDKARAAVEWTRPRLRPSDVEFLRALPLIEQRAGFTVVHGSLHMPDQFGYVISRVEAQHALDEQTTRLCFIGHSHSPCVYLRRTPNTREIDAYADSEIDVSYRGFQRVLLNVGSVGQPRDEDPRAAYGLVDTDEERVWIKRVAYDVPAVQQKILAAGLPHLLASRLALGI